MGSLWVLHRDVLKHYIMGKMNFLKMSGTENVKYVESIKNAGGSYFNLQCANLGNVYHDKTALRVSVKDGIVLGISTIYYSFVIYQ